MGQTDIPLDEEGRKEAKTAANALGVQKMEIDALFCSPLARCVQTAEAFAGVLDLRMQIVPELRERGWGLFEGQPKSVRARTSNMSGVESLTNLLGRVRPALDLIEQQTALPLIITHSGVIQAALGEPSQASKRRIPHLRPVEVQWPLPPRT